MTAACAPQTTCVVCDATVTPLLDLDVQPPANLLLKDASVDAHAVELERRRRH